MHVRVRSMSNIYIYICFFVPDGDGPRWTKDVDVRYSIRVACRLHRHGIRYEQREECHANIQPILYLTEVRSPARTHTHTHTHKHTSDAGHEGKDGYHAKGKANLGLLDTSFLFAYAVAMFFSGHVGDRKSLRTYLTIGLLGA